VFLGPPYGPYQVDTPAEAYTPFTVQTIAQDPWVIENLDPDQVLQALRAFGGPPPDAQIGPGNSSSLGEGPGWKLYVPSGGGIQIRWSPGSAVR
jgi:hypothetical protein